MAVEDGRRSTRTAGTEVDKKVGTLASSPPQSELRRLMHGWQDISALTFPFSACEQTCLSDQPAQAEDMPCSRGGVRSRLLGGLNMPVCHGQAEALRLCKRVGPVIRGLAASAIHGLVAIQHCRDGSGHSLPRASQTPGRGVTCVPEELSWMEAKVRQRPGWSVVSEEKASLSWRKGPISFPGRVLHASDSLGAVNKRQPEARS